MIKIKPALDMSFTCPGCGSKEATIIKALAPGIFWLVQCECRACKDSFEGTLPVGHTIDLSITWNKSKHELLVNRDASIGIIGASRWLPEVFERFVINRRTQHASIRKIIYHEAHSVIILNALDSIYGHSLLKLYNAQHHLDNNRDKGLVIIIPQALEWLLPRGCAEAWVVDLPLSELKFSYAAIEDFVKDELNRFDEVFVSRAYSHPDFTAINIERFTGIRSFDLSAFTTTTPCFTFVLRADRPWLRNRVSGGFHWLFMKLKILRRMDWLFSADQNYLVRRTIAIIRSHFPSCEIYVTGFGKQGRFKYVTSDERYDAVNVDIEKRWCRIYSKSHVIIGVHGSNMLLPSAFAAGCLEILPAFRTYNIVQDLSVRYNDRRQLFLYRFVDQFVSPKSLATKAIALVTHYNSFYRNMTLNVYKAKTPYDEGNS